MARRSTTTTEAGLVEANMPLVRGIARRFVGRGLDLDDLIQTGCIGLLVAVRHHDPARGTLATIATPAITQAIRRAVERGGRTIRIPRAIASESARLAVVEHDMRCGLDEAGAVLGTTAETLARVKAARLAGAVAGGIDGMEVDAPDRADAAEHDARLDDPLAWVDRLACLAPRELVVIALRFGLGGGEPLSGDDAGKFLRCTRQAVSLRERKALARLGIKADGKGRTVEFRQAQ